MASGDDHRVEEVVKEVEVRHGHFVEGHGRRGAAAEALRGEGAVGQSLLFIINNYYLLH